MAFMDVSRTPAELDTQKTLQKTFSLACAGKTAAGSPYTVCTSTDDLVISEVIPDMSVAGSGFISVALATNATTPQEYLSAAEGAVAALTGGKTIVNANRLTRNVLPSGKAIQATFVGTGSGGSLNVTVRFTPKNQGGTLN